MTLLKHFNFIESDEPSLEDDSFELIADSNYYVQDASAYGGGYIAHNPRGQVGCRTLDEALKDARDTYLRVTAFNNS